MEPSNLQRQILHQESRLGQNKADSAAQTLHGLNSHVDVKAYPCFLDAPALEKLVQQYDIVIDAADQLKNKFMINDVCVAAGKPFVHGGITGFSGQVMTYVPGKGSCYRCIFGDIPAGDAPAPIPVIGVTAGIIGTIQAAEAISAGQRHTAHRKAAGAGRQPDAVPDSAVPSCFRGVSAAQEMIQTKGAT